MYEQGFFWKFFVIMKNYHNDCIALRQKQINERRQCAIIKDPLTKIRNLSPEANERTKKNKP